MKYVTQSRSQGVNDTASNTLSIEEVLPICRLGPQKSTNIQTVIQTRQCKA